jgi:MSHA biogenesis protein MshP
MKRACSGFALVTAIFLLVVMAALGVFMLTLSGAQQAAPRQSLLATRVYYGAKAGLDWGVQQAIAANSCTGGAGTTFALAGTGLTGVSATVVCISTSHTGGTVYRITSTAVTGAFGALDYAQRRMEATVSNIP